jgi:hypothetical protein
MAYQARRSAITVEALAERDGWACYLCGEAIDPALVMPDPASATIDHVQPVGLGGADSLQNVRLAHFRCNRAKGMRTVVMAGPPAAGRRPLRSDTVTKPVGTVRCRWCGRGFDVVAGPGRPRAYCKRSCRQREYEANRRAKELGLNETELVMARSELDQLRDALYVLEAAVEDVDRDMETGADDPVEVRRALNWLLDAARPLLSLRP